MKWDLKALKMLAKAEEVPGTALRDAVVEIEKLRMWFKVIRNEAEKRGATWCIVILDQIEGKV